MTEDKQPDTGNKSGNSDTPPSGSERENPQDIPDTHPKSENCRYVKQESPNIIVNVPAPIVNNIQQPQRDKWTIATRISASSVIVTIILIGVTYWLFMEARIQSKAATDAAIAADSTVKITRYYDSISRINQDMTFASNQEDSKERFQHDSASLQAQINSIKEAQKQFEMENRPYIEVSNFDTLSFRENEYPVLRMAVRNLGKQPAKILRSVAVVYCDKASDNSDTAYNGFYRMVKENGINVDTFRDENRYIIKEAPFYKQLNWPVIIDVYHRDQILSGELDIYIIGKMTYLNLITKIEMLYKYAIEVRLANQIVYKIIYNDNVENTNKEGHKKKSKKHN